MLVNNINRYVAAYLIALLLQLTATMASSNPLFPQPEELKPDIQFWTRVYTEISTQQGFIHDNKYLGVVYETVNIAGLSPKKRKNKIKAVKKKYISILNTLASGARKNLTAEERRVFKLFPKGMNNKAFKQAKSRVRFQLGQSDKFKAGLERSGRWKPHILKTLRDMNLPEEIYSLPQVESSYNQKAYSRVGAAGMWQFMRSTGRRFMRVDHVVDERLDPFISSVSAARLLEQNYKTTGAWPLAITAYNHGAAGMRRAAKQVGTKDVVKILRNYRSRTFKFASRNFYVAFIAAVNIHKNPEKYFGTLNFDAPELNIRYTLPGYMAADALAREVGISVKQLKELNPALRPNVWNGNKLVPKGYAVRLPAESHKNRLAASLASGNHIALHRQQKPDVTYRVKRGDNLSSIAQRFNVSVNDLMAFNNIRKSNYIRIGQVLRLPQKASSQTASTQSADGSYTVRRGDTLSTISKKFNISEKTLMNINGLKDRNKIFLNQKLLLSMDNSPNPNSTINKKLKGHTQNSSTKEKKSDPSMVQLANNDKSKPTAPPVSEPIKFKVDRKIEEVPALEDEEVIALETKDIEKDEEKELDIDADVTSVASHQPLLAADPNDYAVSKDNRITVLAEETLGHYGDWLQIKTNDIRRLNKMSFRKPVVIGQKLKLKFEKITKEQFENLRLAYHSALQEEYFNQFTISGTQQHVVKRGDSIWNLTQKHYKIPLWLLVQYNPELVLHKLKPGDKLIFPTVSEKTE